MPRGFAHMQTCPEGQRLCNLLLKRNESGQLVGNWFNGNLVCTSIIWGSPKSTWKKRDIRGRNTTQYTDSACLQDIGSHREQETMVFYCWASVVDGGPAYGYIIRSSVPRIWNIGWTVGHYGTDGEGVLPNHPGKTRRSLNVSFNVGPLSANLTQDWTNLGERLRSIKKHLSNIYTMSAQRLRRWPNIV